MVWGYQSGTLDWRTCYYKVTLTSVLHHSRQAACFRSTQVNHCVRVNNTLLIDLSPFSCASWLTSPCRQPHGCPYPFVKRVVRCLVFPRLNRCYFAAQQYYLLNSSSPEEVGRTDCLTKKQLSGCHQMYSVHVFVGWNKKCFLCSLGQIKLLQFWPGMRAGSVCWLLDSFLVCWFAAICCVFLFKSYARRQYRKPKKCWRCWLNAERSSLCVEGHHTLTCLLRNSNNGLALSQTFDTSWQPGFVPEDTQGAFTLCRASITLAFAVSLSSTELGHASLAAHSTYRNNCFAKVNFW